MTSLPEPDRSGSTPLCVMCEQQGTQKCGECRQIDYCSKACQKRDWPIHKLVCKTLKDFSEDKRPGPEYKRGILFPEDGQKPHYIWIEFRTKPCQTGDWDCGEGDNHALNCEQNFPNCYFRAVVNPVLNRELQYKLALSGVVPSAESHRALANHKVNRSLLKIDQELQGTWYRNIVACGHHHVRGEPQAEIMYDLGPTEFRNVVDLLRFHHDLLKKEIQEKIDGPTTTVVRIACTADVFVLFHKYIETLPVSTSLCEMESDIASPMMDRIGMPLVFRQLPLSLSWRDGRAAPPYLEITGTNFCMMSLNPDIPIIPGRHKVGSSIVVRKDGKPLSENHIRAFIDYGRFNACSCDKNDPTNVCACVGSAKCSKEHFMTWYTDWTRAQVAGSGGVLGNGPSPYDV